MDQIKYIGNDQEINLKKKHISNNEINNHFQLEKDLCILINYVRTNPLDFCDNLISKNKYKKLSKEQFELINFLKDAYNKGALLPFQEIPEISKAAKNLLNNLALNNNKNQDLNLRKRLSQYGHRSGRIFETVVFKTDRAEDIVNYILFEEKGRNMILNNKMKYIGISCGILPQKIMCTVIDIVQDFIPFDRKVKKDANNIINYINDNFDKSPCHKKYKTQNLQNISEINYDSSINNLKLKLENRESQINYNNTQNMNIIINNNHNNINNKNYINNFDNNNNEYIPNLFLNKYSNQRKKNTNSKINEYNKTSFKKRSSMEEKENYFSPNSIKSYNIIINNKISPKRNNLNNIIIIKKDFNNNNNFSYNINQKKEIETRNKNNNHNVLEGKEIVKENNDMFTMAGRTSKEQKEVLEISTKMNLIKSKSLCSFDLNSNNSKNNNNRLQRLNFQEKIEILHKINQRNHKPKSLSSNKIIYDNIIGKTPFSTKTKDYNEISTIKYDSNLKIAKIGEKDRKFSFNTSKHLSSEKEKSNFNNYKSNTPIRFKTFIYKMNEFNRNNFNDNQITPSYPSYMETKSNKGNEICDINEEYSLNKINEIKNDLILFKNKIKKELKDEVKNEIKEEIKNEINSKQRPDSIEIDQDYEINNNILNSLISNNNNYQLKEEKDNDGENQVKIIDDEIYFKKNNGNYLAKNTMKNRCLSEKKFFYVKKNINNNATEINNSKERKKNVSNIKENIFRDKYKETYEQMNYMTKISVNKINKTSLQNINNNNNDNSYEIKNKSFFNDNNKIKKKKEIKKLIKLYNIAKDSKRNISRSNKENVYNITSYNKSIPNYFLRQNNYNSIIKNCLERNKNNEECSNICFDDEEYNKIQNFNCLNNNHLIKEETEKKDINNKNNSDSSNCNQKKYYKSGGKIYEFINDNNKAFSIEKMEKKNENQNAQNELNTIYDKNIKENFVNQEGDSFINTRNEILSITGRFIDDNSIQNIMDNKDSGIKSYTEKNIKLYKKEKSFIKTKNKNIYNPSHYSSEKIDIKENHENKSLNQDNFKVFNSKTMSNINYIKNNKIKNEKYEKKIRGCFRGEKKDEKYKTPNHIQKQVIFEENINNKNNKFSNIISKMKTSYYKPKKYMSYQYFLSNNHNFDQKE